MTTTTDELLDGLAADAELRALLYETLNLLRAALTALLGDEALDGYALPPG